MAYRGGALWQNGGPTWTDTSTDSNRFFLSEMLKRLKRFEAFSCGEEPEEPASGNVSGIIPGFEVPVCTSSNSNFEFAVEVVNVSASVFNLKLTLVPTPSNPP